MSSRYYFYTMDGKQIESDLSFKECSSGGSSIAVEENGKWNKKMFETFKGKLWAREEIGIFESMKTLKERKITIDDFEEKEIVVKFWCVNKNAREWFVLTKMEENEKLACDVPMSF
jgi:hypothetical protein